MDPGSSLVSHDSILLHHGTVASRAVVLLHGLTASPRQFEMFGQMLYERGANVYIPRLPLHGYGDRMTNALEELNVLELKDFARRSAAYAAALGERVIVVGFSVGGLLAAWIAQHVAVQRAVCVAPFLGVAWLPSRFTGQAARLALRARNHFLWWDPIRRERLLPEHGYPRFSTHAVARAASLGEELLTDARAWPPAAHDVLIVLNASELTVNNRAARRLASAWASHRPGEIVLHRFKGLPLSHDIIEPLRSADIVRCVYPPLLDLVDR